MGKGVLKIVGGGVAAFVVLLIAGWFMVSRGDIPYAMLDQKWASPGSHYVQAGDGLKVHYFDQGNPKGPTLVLLHGFAMSAETWDPWVKRLGKDYHIVTLDLPGFGLTESSGKWSQSYVAMADAVAAFTASQKLSNFVIGGSSMGGGVAWRYTLKHPEQVKGLILVDSSGWPEKTPITESPMVKAAKDPGLRSVLVKLDNSKQLKSGFRAAFANPDLAGDAYAARYIELSRAPGRRAVWLGLLTGWEHQDFATPDRLAAIKAPTLVLWGDKDRLLPLADGRRFTAAIPGAHLIVFPGVGHLPQEEAADASAADVAAYMRSIAPPAAKKSATGAATPTGVLTKKQDPAQSVFY